MLNPMPASTAALLGIDSYSIRALGWKALALIDYVAKLGGNALQISNLNELESLEPAHLAKVKQTAIERGVQLDGGIGCICRTARGWNPREGDPVTYLTKGIKVAHAIGAKAMRCYMGNNPDRLGATPLAAHIEQTMQSLRAVKSIATDLGVRVAIENHGDLTARETKLLIEESGSGHVGACLDTGNPMWVLEDPMLTVEVLAPYAVTTHVRDSALVEHPRGAAFQWVASGDGSVNHTAVIAKIRQLAPAAPLQLEVITGRPPQALPYLEAAHWRTYAALPAADFARFVQLAKRGHAYAGPMVIADGMADRPAEYEAALRSQQRFDLERSFRWTQQVLKGLASGA